MAESGKIWYKLRGALIVPFYIFPIFYQQGSCKGDASVLIAGAAVFALGWGLRIWAQMHLHYRLKAHKKLTLTGPYLYVRNPIYIGNTLILAGFTSLTGLVWFVPFMVLACAFTYHMTVLYEEKHLTNKYGQGYVEFLGRIPRWLPNFKGTEAAERYDVKPYFVQSIIAELHILVLLLPLLYLYLYR